MTQKQRLFKPMGVMGKPYITLSKIPYTTIQNKNPYNYLPQIFPKFFKKINKSQLLKFC